MEPKPAQSNGWMHGTVTSIAAHRGHKTYYNFIAKLDDGRHFVLKQSYAPPPDARAPASAYTPAFQQPPSSFGCRRRSDPEPLEIGSHVMVNPDQRCCERDTRVKYPVAGMWRRAKQNEIPAAPAAAPAFQEREPLPEPPAHVDVPAVRTTPFSKNSEVARAIERELSAAMRTRTMGFVLYDPLAPPGYPPFLCLVRLKDDLDWAADAIEQMSGSRVGCVRNIGSRISGFIDNMPQSSLQSCMDKAAGRITFIPVPGLSCVEHGIAKIENEVLHFCMWDALPPST